MFYRENYFGELQASRRLIHALKVLGKALSSGFFFVSDG